jgi:predicted MFS family arabinose efflux permease
MSWVLGAYGVAGFLGTFAGERLTRLSKRFAFPMASAVMAASLLWCLTMPHSWAAIVPPIFCWGASYGAIPVSGRIWLYNAAPEMSDIVSAFYVSAFQFALAAGAFTGGLVVDSGGITAMLGYAATAVAAGGVVMLVASFRSAVALPKLALE